MRFPPSKQRKYGISLLFSSPDNQISYTAISGFIKMVSYILVYNESLVPIYNPWYERRIYLSLDY